jgi:hypothetical protein
MGEIMRVIPRHPFFARRNPPPRNPAMLAFDCNRSYFDPDLEGMVRGKIYLPLKVTVMAVAICAATMLAAYRCWGGFSIRAYETLASFYFHFCLLVVPLRAIPFVPEKLILQSVLKDPARAGLFIFVH